MRELNSISLFKTLAFSVTVFSVMIHGHRSPSLEAGDYDIDDVIVRDIAIVGGGASGTYAAVRLQQDFNKSIILVEHRKALGGHTETYVDPQTKTTIDLGVLAFHDLPVTRDFFARFNIALAPMSFDFNHSTTIDFRTGRHVDVPLDRDATADALSRYAAHLERYPTLSEGYVFPVPVPEDLLLPFGEFAVRYNYTAMISSAWQVSQGYGDILSLPTLYVFKAFGPEVVRGLFTGYLTTLRHNNHEIYEKALRSLGNGTNVLLRSSIVATERDSDEPFVHAVVATPSGYKLLRVKQFLFTLPPKLECLTGFDLDQEEVALFSEFTSNDYYTGLLQNVPLVQGTVLSNMVTDPSNFYLPRLPTSYNLGPGDSYSNLTNVKFCSNATMAMDEVQDQVVAEVSRSVPDSAPRFAAFLSHGPFALQVPVASISNGFYHSLYQLQGRRRSFWTGAAWHTHDSSLLWNFTEPILRRMQEADMGHHTGR